MEFTHAVSEWAGAVITVLTGALAFFFSRLLTRFDLVDAKVDEVKETQAHISEKLGTIISRFDDMEEGVKRAQKLYTELEILKLEVNRLRKSNGNGRYMEEGN
jgi:hypothetical protein